MATHSCSCLENPRDRGAWWAAVYGVAQSLTQLKRLSSSSSSSMEVGIPTNTRVLDELKWPLNPQNCPYKFLFVPTIYTVNIFI